MPPKKKATPKAPSSHDRASGEMIYTPHDCELPVLGDLAVGTIWACYGYREGRMCKEITPQYDQWIIVAGENGTKSWRLFQRNI